MNPISSSPQEMFSTPSSTMMEYELLNSTSSLATAIPDKQSSNDMCLNDIYKSMLSSEKPFMPFEADLYSKDPTSTDPYLQQKQQLMFFDPLVTIIPPALTIDPLNAFSNPCGSMYMPSLFMPHGQNIIDASPLSQFDMYCDIPSSDASTTTLSTPPMVQQSGEFEDIHQPPSIEYIDRFIAEHEAKLVEPLCQSAEEFPAAVHENSQQEDKQTAFLSQHQQQSQITASVSDTNCWSYWTFPNGSSSIPKIITTAPDDSKTADAAVAAAATTALSADFLNKVNIQDANVKVMKRRGRGKGVKNKKSNKLANKKLVVAAAAAAAAHMVAPSSSSSIQTSKKKSTASLSTTAANDATVSKEEPTTTSTTKSSSKAWKTSSRIPLEGALYVCQHENCGKAFTRPYNLTSHMRTHTTERPYACSSCGRKFARQHDRNRHEKLHWGIRPYACHHCRKTFARMDALNRHLRMDKGCTVTHGLSF